MELDIEGVGVLDVANNVTEAEVVTMAASPHSSAADTVMKSLARLEWNAEKILEKAMTVFRLTLKNDLMPELLREVSQLLSTEQEHHRVQTLAQQLLDKHFVRLFGVDVGSLVFILEHCSVDDADMALNPKQKQAELRNILLSLLPDWVTHSPEAVWTVTTYKLSASDRVEQFGFRDPSEVPFVMPDQLRESTTLREPSPGIAPVCVFPEQPVGGQEDAEPCASSAEGSIDSKPSTEKPSTDKSSTDKDLSGHCDLASAVEEDGGLTSMKELKMSRTCKTRTQMEEDFRMPSSFPLLSCREDMAAVQGAAYQPGLVTYAGAPSPGREDEPSWDTEKVDAELCTEGSEETEVMTFLCSDPATQSPGQYQNVEESDEDDFFSCNSSEETDDHDPVQGKGKVTGSWNAPGYNNGRNDGRGKQGKVEEFDNQQTMPESKELREKNIEVLPAERLLMSLDNSNEEWKGEGELDAEMREIEPEPLNLRPYQEELAGEGLMGRNVVIVAPTGSGKTHVALCIIQNHLEQVGSGVRKVMFLVNQVALAQQQYDACRKYLTAWRIKLVTGNAGAGATKKVPMKHQIMRADIVVMTAQILINALDSKEVNGVCAFSLVVFDECHHTTLQHPFNCIMHYYMDVKYRPDSQEDCPPPPLPQVVGLTASVGVGKAGNQEQARKHIVKLCAHLDANTICTVRKNTEQLALFSNEPQYEQQICGKRPNDQFQEQIEEIMNKIESRMEKSEYLNCDDTAPLKEKLKLRPRFRGTSQYTGWVSELVKTIAMLDDAEARRFFDAARVMLKFYNESMAINDECDTQEALAFLQKQLTEVYDPLGKRGNDMDRFLKDLFDKNLPFLTAVSRQQSDTNPKLICLEKILLKAFSDEPESRAIVFVKTRDLSSALLKWMLRRPHLKALKPGRMVGAGLSTDRGGMTKHQQVDVMEFFRTGERRVLIATSVAEEGLDIRKCNLVIRYNYVSNEIAMVQARGRARAENSQFLTLASHDQGVQAKEEVNFIREMMMHEAIKGLQVEIRTSPSAFRNEMEEVQKEEKSKRDAEMAVRQGRRLRQGEVVFRCRNCDAYAFVSSDVRKIEGAHHVVTDLDYRNRNIERICPPQEYGQIQVRGQVLCKACGENWGPVLRFQNIKFPCIRLEGFRLIDEHSRKDIPKRWKQVQIIIGNLEPEELMRYREEAIAVDYVDLGD